MVMFAGLLVLPVNNLVAFLLCHLHNSFPVLAGRYPKRKTADSSYSPTAAALHGQRKRQARTPPERKGSTVSSDGETLPSPGSLGVPSQCRPSTPCKNSTSPETAHAATPSTNSTSSSMSVASPSVFCGTCVLPGSVSHDICTTL